MLVMPRTVGKHRHDQILHSHLHFVGGDVHPCQRCPDQGPTGTKVGPNRKFLFAEPGLELLCAVLPTLRTTATVSMITASNIDWDAVRAYMDTSCGPICLRSGPSTRMENRSAISPRPGKEVSARSLVPD